MTPNRRSFLKHAFLAAAALSAPARLAAQRTSSARAAGSPAAGAFIVDTNVDIHSWPFRQFKYGEPRDLVAKLRKHKIRQAWCGSFDALFHKNIDSVNARLTEDCRALGEGILIPFGTVNPAFPDWREDLRRCDEVYGMRGIKLHPVYHGYTLEDPRFQELLEGTVQRGLLVQIAVQMQDRRMQHPLVAVPAVDLAPLPDVLREVPGARVVLANAFDEVRGRLLETLVNETGVSFEYSNLDAVASIERVMRGEHWYLSTAIPQERLLFGSHFPYFPLENALFKLIESPLNQAQIDSLAFGNAQRLLARRS